MAKEPTYSEVTTCRHCGNVAPMGVIGSAENVQTYHLGCGLPMDAGILYEVWLCPACSEVTLVRGNWNEGMEDRSEYDLKVIFPSEKGELAGLPKDVGAEYAAAQQVAKISPNAHAVLLGRVLDYVCSDRGASGGTLAERLDDLATRQEIPNRLAALAHKLRQLRNVGAHADLGTLTKAEIPVLEALCRAVLEYVYTAPLLLKEVEERLRKIKAKSPTKPTLTTSPNKKKLPKGVKPPVVDNKRSSGTQLHTPGTASASATTEE